VAAGAWVATVVAAPPQADNSMAVIATNAADNLSDFIFFLLVGKNQS
jgi:hypothetical protein